MTRTPLLGIFAAVSEDPDRALRTAQQIAEDVREQIRRARKAEAAARAEAEKWEQALAVVESRMGEHIAAVEEEKALSIDTERVTIRHEMQASEYAASAKAPGRKSRSEHPFPMALKERRPPITVAQWADAHGLSRTTVMSWFLDGAAGRRIPRKYAREIAREFKVPMTAWVNGIKD